MIKRVLHKLHIKPIRIEFAELDSVGGYVSLPQCFLILLRKPRFLRKGI